MSFTLDEMDKLAPAKDDDEDVVCEWVAKEESDKADHVKKVKACTDKVFACLFGKNHHNLSGHTRVTKIINKAFPPIEVDTGEIEEDLGESLNLLDDCLVLMEKMLSKHPHLMSVEWVDQMEEVAEHIGQWGMGEHTESIKGTEKATTITLK